MPTEEPSLHPIAQVRRDIIELARELVALERSYDSWGIRANREPKLAYTAMGHLSVKRAECLRGLTGRVDMLESHIGKTQLRQALATFDQEDNIGIGE